MDTAAGFVPGKGTEKIMLCDDEEQIIRVEEKALKRLGYQVETFLSAEKAFESFKANPYGYDAVITDMTMPRMTGDFLAQEMTAIRPDLPVILVTGYSERIDEEIDRTKGIRLILMKPVSMSDLSRALRRVLDGTTDLS